MKLSYVAMPEGTARGDKTEPASALVCRVSDHFDPWCFSHQLALLRIQRRLVGVKCKLD
jgi:hypothetical protein